MVANAVQQLGAEFAELGHALEREILRSRELQRQMQSLPTPLSVQEIATREHALHQASDALHDRWFKLVERALVLDQAVHAYTKWIGSDGHEFDLTCIGSAYALRDASRLGLVRLTRAILQGQIFTQNNDEQVVLDVNAQEVGTLNTALHLAVSANQSAVAQCLLTEGHASPEIRNAAGLTAFDLALSLGNTDLAEQLLPNMPAHLSLMPSTPKVTATLDLLDPECEDDWDEHLQNDPAKLVFYAAIRGYQKAVTAYLNKGVSPDERLAALGEVGPGLSILQMACLSESPEMVRDLLARGARIPTPEGCKSFAKNSPPLHLAVGMGCQSSANALLMSGADLHQEQGTACSTPLALAVQSRDSAMVQFLLNAARERGGVTALHRIVLHYEEKDEGRSILEYAIDAGSLRTVSRLLDALADDPASLMKSLPGGDEEPEDILCRAIYTRLPAMVARVLNTMARHPPVLAHLLTRHGDWQDGDFLRPHFDVALHTDVELGYPAMTRLLIDATYNDPELRATVLGRQNGMGLTVLETARAMAASEPADFTAQNIFANLEAISEPLARPAVGPDTSDPVRMQTQFVSDVSRIYEAAGCQTQFQQRKTHYEAIQKKLGTSSEGRRCLWGMVSNFFDVSTLHGRSQQAMAEEIMPTLARLIYTYETMQQWMTAVAEAVEVQTTEGQRLEHPGEPPRKRRVLDLDQGWAETEMCPSGKVHAMPPVPGACIPLARAAAL